MLHFIEGPISEDRRRKKAQHPAWIEPTTSLLRGMFSTTPVLQPLPEVYELILASEAKLN